MVSLEINLSQQQEDFNNHSFACSDEDSEEFTSNDHPIFTDKLALFKRAQDLCGDDVDRNKELYNFLNNFVHNNELDNNDNAQVLSKRNNGEITTISSNKVVNTKKTSNKRYKASYEK